MLNNGIEEINQLNKEFYEAHNESFSKSRKDNFWEGFSSTLQFIKPGSKVLDLGCGNARFLEFLLKNHINCEYLGIDNSKEFISNNKLNYPEAEFEIVDAINNISEINQIFDFIGVFGVTHHIPSREFRKKWFEDLNKLVSLNGYLYISFWNFDTSKADLNFKPKMYQVEDGDFFLGWKGDFKQHRFCHKYSSEELNEIKSYFQNFEIVSEFESDDNKYLVFKRIN